MLHITERNQDATLYVGGLDDQCTEAILWELFTQAGPVVNVHMPKDRITGSHQGYGFVEFASEEDADYAMKVMNMVKLFGKSLRANKASAHQKNQDIGANIFIGNLDPDVDEKLLYDTFSSFGPILQTPRVMRDFGSQTSRAYAFINYGSFEASDAAIEAMNGQYFSNRPITVTYAFKKDSKTERHGTMVERLLAQKNKMLQVGGTDKSMSSNDRNDTLGQPASFQPVPNILPPPPMTGANATLVGIPPNQIPMLGSVAPMVALNPLASMNPIASMQPLLGPLQAPPPPPPPSSPPPPPPPSPPPPPPPDF